MDEPAESPEPQRHGLYEASSQYRHWRFSPEQLAQMRGKSNKTAVDITRAAFERDEPGSSAALVFPTAQEELALVRFYVAKIPQLCQLFRFSEEIEATGITYLKRFYLRNTVMHHHPKNVMLTALFLAAKTCNRPVSIADYAARIPKTTPDDVLSLEFPVAQALNFEFAVWHPHRALWGLFLDAQTLSPPPDPNSLHSAYNAALADVRRSRLSDVDALYAPAQVAFACLHRADKELAERWLAAKVERGVKPDIPHIVVDEVLNLVDAEGMSPSTDVVRDVDKRLKQCKNPETIPGSRAFLRKQAEHEAFLAAKRKRKADMAREVMADEDNIFGGADGSAAKPMEIV